MPYTRTKPKKTSAYHRSVLVWVTLCLLIVVRLCDLIITLRLTPDLSREGNPVVTLFGGGAGSMLSVVTVFSVLALAGLFAYWRGPSLLVNLTPVSLSQYVLEWMRQVACERQPFTAYLPRGSHAKQGLQAVRLFGLALSWSLIFGSTEAVHAWLLIWAFPDPSFLTTYSFIRIGRTPLVPLIAAAAGLIFGSWLFFLSEHKTLAHRKSSDPSPVPLHHP